MVEINDGSFPLSDCVIAQNMTAAAAAAAVVSG